MRSTKFSSSRILLAVLVPIGLVVVGLVPILGYLVGTDSNLPIVVLIGMTLIMIGIVRWQWLLVVFVPLISSWALLDLGVGLSVARVIAIPAFIGFAFYFSKRPSLPRLPAGGMIAVTLFVFVLVIGLLVNPSPVGFERFFRLLQKVGWCYILFVALTQAGLSGLRRFGSLMIFSIVISCAAGILALQHFGSGVRLTDMTAEDNTWELIRLIAEGITTVIPLMVLPVVEMTQAKNVIKKLLLYALFVTFLLLAILITVNRWILVISPVILLYLGFFGAHKQRKLMLVSLVAGVYIFYNLILPNSWIWQQRYQTLLTRTFTEEEGRYAQLETAREVIKHSPIWGFGLGQSENIGQVALSVRVGARGTSVSHNSFLSMVIDVGVLGLLGVLALWGSLVYGTVKFRRRLTSGYLNELMRVMPIMIIVLMWGWTVGDMIRDNFTWLLFGLFWAVIWFAERDKTEQLVQKTASSVGVEVSRSDPL